MVRENAVLLEQIKADFGAYFDTIRSVSFSAEVIREKLVETPGVSNPILRGDIRFLADGKKYRLDDQSNLTIEGNNLVAFDEVMYQRLSYGDRRIWLRKMDANEVLPNEYFFLRSNPLLMPFEFLNPWLAKGEVRSIGLVDLKQPDIWENFLSRLIKLSENFDGADARVTVELKGGRDHVSGKESFYRVTLDAGRRMYPVKIERIADNQELISSYEITELAVSSDSAGGTVWIPVSAVRKVFTGVQEHPYRADPWVIARYVIKDIALNPEIDESEFIIDPAIADSIYDANNQVMIRVPR